MWNNFFSGNRYNHIENLPEIRFLYIVPKVAQNIELAQRRSLTENIIVKIKPLTPEEGRGIITITNIIIQFNII